MFGLADALITIGRDPALPAFRNADTAAVRRVLDRYCMRRALLRSFAARDLDPAYGNRVVFADIPEASKRRILVENPRRIFQA